MRVLSWNCRGLGSKVKEEAMKDLISLAQLDILLIQDTKMEKDAFLQVSAKFWKKGGGITISSREAYEEIGSLWDDHKFEVTDIKQSSHWILTTLLQKETKVHVRLFKKKIVGIFSEIEGAISRETSF